MAQTRVGCLGGIVLSAVVASTFATGALAQAQSGQVPNEDQFLASEDGWDTYVNGRFGMRLTYPVNVFSPAEAAPEGDGRRFEAEDARIEVSAWRNDADVTPSDLVSQLLEAEGYRDLVRHEVGEARLILFGYRADRVFYEEYHFEGATVQALGIEYPVARGATYQPLAEAVAALFMPGAEVGADWPAEEPGEPPSVVARSAESERLEPAEDTPQPGGTAAENVARPEIVEEPTEPLRRLPKPVPRNAPRGFPHSPQTSLPRRLLKCLPPNPR